jgi:hypothetical protein
LRKQVGTAVGFIKNCEEVLEKSRLALRYHELILAYLKKFNPEHLKAYGTNRIRHFVYLLMEGGRKPILEPFCGPEGIFVSNLEIQKTGMEITVTKKQKGK